MMFSIRHLLKPWMVLVLVISAVLVSFSFTLRFYRESRTVIQRREQTLQQLRQLRQQVAQPSSGLQLLSDTEVRAPFGNLSDPTLGAVNLIEPVNSEPIGFGLHRWKVLLGVDDLRPTNVGKLFASLEGPDRAWWVTEVSLRASDKGLTGQLKVEALDKSPADQ